MKVPVRARKKSNGDWVFESIGNYARNFGVVRKSLEALKTEADKRGLEVTEVVDSSSKLDDCVAAFDSLQKRMDAYAARKDAKDEEWKVEGYPSIGRYAASRRVVIKDPPGARGKTSWKAEKWFESKEEAEKYIRDQGGKA